MRNPLPTLLALSLLAAPAFAQREYGFDNRKPSGQEYLTPEETVKRMKVAPEFEVKLFAGEPNCVNPIAFTIDEKGRVWVVECFEYPSRTPKGKAPRDRIVILEDTDGDGVCDKRTVFAEGKDFPVSDERKKAGLGAFDLASGIEVGNGGVYVGAPPYLWFIENKDDKPGKFERVLSGFGSEDTHETLNTFQWGPDGWLYGMHGVFTQSNVKPLDGPETRMNAAVWRFHPKTKKFEIFAEGTSNPWGLDWRNTDGQFILACCVIPHLYHIVPGGIYKRQAGASYNPYAYGEIKEICDHTFHKESGWAHAGLISLDAPHIPEKYRNSVIFGSIHGCSVKQNILKPNGSSFTATRGDDFLVSGDKNFRPINMKWGPNGDIYLIDWHDQNPCHQAAANSWDYERGRVYRIQLKDTKACKTFDLSKWTDDELVALSRGWVGGGGLGQRIAGPKLRDITRHDTPGNPSPTPYWVRTAGRLLTERWEKLEEKTKEGLLNTLGHDYWHQAAGGASEKQVQFGIDGTFRHEEWMRQSRPGTPKSYNAVGRAGLVRALVEASPGPDGLKRLTELAGKEQHVNVRRELASAAIRLADKHDVSELVRALMKHKEDATDPLIPHLTWLAYEKVISKKDGAANRAEKELAFLAKEAPDNIFVRDQIVPKVMRRLVATGQPDDLKLCVKFLADVTDVNTREKALDGLVIALTGQTVDAPENWKALQPELRMDGRLAGLTNKLAVSFRDPEAVARAVAVLEDYSKPVGERAEAIRQLVLLKAKDADVTLMRFVTGHKGAMPLRIEAARGLVAFDKPGIAKELLAEWNAFPQPLRTELVNTLAARKPWAVTLLKAMEAKAVDRTLVTDNTVLKMQAFNDKDVNALIEKAWGRVRKTPDELNKLIDKTRDSLYAAPASFARGKKVFDAQCAKCHKFDGAGNEVGPQLDGAGRDIEYLLANVLDPNRVVGAPYFVRTATLLDGQVIQGVLAAEDDQTVTLKVENAVLKKIARKDLDGPVKVAEKSMMPEGLAAGMTEQDFRDLVRYVMASPYLTDVTVNDKPVSVGAPGRIPLPKPAGTVTIAAEVTATGAMRTKLLVGASDPFTVQVDGKPVARGEGTGKRPQPDAEGFDVELPAGKHTLTITVASNGATDAVYARFLDPDRKLSYPEK
jgi:putative membrane-bound dehydrogenase-like protein